MWSSLDCSSLASVSTPAGIGASICVPRRMSWTQAFAPRLGRVN
jgi:hypothetical protein